MPIHDLGYRGWKERLASPWTRWVVIAQAGIHRAWQGAWLKRLMFFAWLPSIWFGSGFFFWEHSLTVPEMREALEAFIPSQAAPLKGLTGRFAVEDVVAARHSVWSWLLYTFNRYAQVLIMVLVVGVIAPPLISQDVRSRAFLLYFSRPLSRWQYALGKLATVWFYLLMLSAAPALALYVLGVLLSPSVNVVYDTWDLPLRVVAAATVLMLPTASLALCMSSCTQESRYAGFAWFAVWILGFFTYVIMIGVEMDRHGIRDATAIYEKWSPVSLYHALGQVQSWVFGFSNFDQIKVPAATLAVLTVLSTIIMFRRISAPLRA
jgi:ABC-type transport system involved in multi-copper enzyme maturation permease subunit